MPINALSIGAGVGVCLSAALSVLFVAVPLLSRPDDLPTGAALASIGLVGVAAGIMIIWSDRHKGRWGWPCTVLALSGGIRRSTDRTGNSTLVWTSCAGSCLARGMEYPVASPKTSGRRANVMEPEDIIERFYRQLQPPSIDEGFEEVVIVRDW